VKAAAARDIARCEPRRQATETRRHRERKENNGTDGHEHVHEHDDRDRDGVIARSEWMRTRSEFNRLDLNRDGFITMSEARLHYR
jgi:EF hand domain-containing protein